jgi:hypothetical protein
VGFGDKSPIYLRACFGLIDATRLAPLRGRHRLGSLHRER